MLRLPTGEYYGETLRRRDANGILVVESRLAARARLPVHAHQNAYLCAVVGGSFTERVGTRARECTASTVKFHQAGEEHSESFGGAGAHLLRIEIPPAWQSIDLGSMVQRMRFDDENRALVLSLVARFHEEMRREDEFAPLVLSALTVELIAAALRTSRAAKPAGPRWLSRVRERIADGSQPPPTLAELAMDCGIHPIHLATTFRRHAGCTIGEYGRRLRVGEAARLLMTTNQPLADVALAAGFADQSHFSRVFRRHTGMTPATFRKSARSDP